LTTSLTIDRKVTVLTVAGTVDLATAQQFEAAAEAAAGSNPRVLIVDLSDVKFLASAGMSILVKTHRRLGVNARFGVVAYGAATSRPLTLTGLDKIFPIYPTLAAAVNADNSIS